MSLFDRIKKCLEEECGSRCMDDEEDLLQTALALEKVMSSEGRQGLIDTIRTISLENKRLADEVLAWKRGAAIIKGMTYEERCEVMTWDRQGEGDWIDAEPLLRWLEGHTGSVPT